MAEDGKEFRPKIPTPEEMAQMRKIDPETLKQMKKIPRGFLRSVPLGGEGQRQAKRRAKRIIK